MDIKPTSAPEFDDDFDFTKTSKRFCGFAIKLGFLKMEQALEALNEQKPVREGEGIESIECILLKHGHLNPEQARLVGLLNNPDFKKIKVMLGKFDKGLCMSAVKNGYVTESNAVICLKLQAYDAIHGAEQRIVGDYLVGLGFLTHPQLNALREQQIKSINFGVVVESTTSNLPEETKIGSMLIREGIVGKTDVYRALASQAEDLRRGQAKRVGDYLVDEGKVGRGEMERIANARRLKRQRLIMESQRRLNAKSRMRAVIFSIGSTAIAFAYWHTQRDSQGDATSFSTPVTAQVDSPRGIGNESTAAPANSKSSEDPPEANQEPRTPPQTPPQLARLTNRHRLALNNNDIDRVVAIPYMLIGNDFADLVNDCASAMHDINQQLEAISSREGLKARHRQGCEELFKVHRSLNAGILKLQRQSSLREIAAKEVLRLFVDAEGRCSFINTTLQLTDAITMPQYKAIIPLVAKSMPTSYSKTIGVGDPHIEFPTGGRWLIIGIDTKGMPISWGEAVANSGEEISMETMTPSQNSFQSQK